MSVIISIPAVKVGVEPALIKGLEGHGPCYFTWNDSVAVGAQCAHCHTIIWANGRENKILNKPAENSVPKSGEGYKKFRQQKISNFLASIPKCPQCGNCDFDRFITNTSFPRLEDGFDFNPDEYSEIQKLDDNLMHVFWMDE